MAESETQSNNQSQQSKSGLVQIAVTTLLILALLGVVVLLYVQGLRVGAEFHYNQAVRAVSGNRTDLEQAQLSGEKAVSLVGFDDRYHRALSQIYLLRINQVVGDDSNPERQQREFRNLVNRAMREAQAAVQVADHDMNNWVNQGSVYETLMNYAVQGAPQAAINSYKKAVELAPTNPALRVRLGRVHLAKAIMESRGEEVNVEQDLQQAGKHLKKALSLRPNYANARYFLGLVYDERGDKQKAIGQFEQIAAINERNKEQVDPILENLEADRPALGERAQPEEIEGMPMEEATSTNATTTATTTVPQQE
ncbi:MAG: tetratricopeptide repeat protein [Candidatus Paceibacterota bacterium]